MAQPRAKTRLSAKRIDFNEQCAAANGGITLLFQSAHLVAAGAELGSLGGT